MPGFIQRCPVLWAAVLVVILTWGAYSNSFRGPFVFDDRASILENPTIEHFGSALYPPAYRTVSGRPVANLSLAVNRRFAGTSPRGYHVGNWLIHLCAGLVLFGIVHRTLRQKPLVEQFGPVALPLALATALGWVLHPLQTESVTYVIQRVESLMGLFYLLTLYFFIRATQPGGARFWYGLSFGACLLGMGTKEVMASAPLIVLLYDRTFVAGSFRRAWAERGSFHAGLAATWLWLAVLVLHDQGRNGTAGLGAGVSSWDYLLTQCQAIPHYLRLCVWPSPLVFDYGVPGVRALRAVLPQALALLALVVATIWAIGRKPTLGFVGAWFFAILAPSSSFVPVVTQGMAEHRMYLSLAAVVVLATTACYRVFGARSLLIWPVVVGLLGGVAYRRNFDYLDEIGLWQDTIAKNPKNPRAYDALGNALADANRVPEAIAEFRRALAIDPNYVESRNNLGVMLDRTHQPAAAAAEFRRVLDLRPEYSLARYNLANALAAQGRTEEALQRYLQVLETRPDDAGLLGRVAHIEMQLGDIFAAIDHFRRELALSPSASADRFNLAFLLFGQGRTSAAQAILRDGIQLDPNYAMGHYNLGNALVQSGDLAAAAEEYRRAAELDPKLVAAYYNLGNVLAQLGQFEAAIQAYEHALLIDAHHELARKNLAEARRQLILQKAK